MEDLKGNKTGQKQGIRRKILKGNKTEQQQGIRNGRLKGTRQTKSREKEEKTKKTAGNIKRKRG